MSGVALSFYITVGVLLHAPFECPLVLLPLLLPVEETAVVTE